MDQCAMRRRDTSAKQIRACTARHPEPDSGRFCRPQWAAMRSLEAADAERPPHVPSGFHKWHVHELVYGYVPAVIAGFLLTAVPNWTGRLPVVGTPLLLLFLTWAAGRLAVLVSLWAGPGTAAVIDLAFLAALGVAVAREIIAGNNARNLKVLGVVALLLIAMACFIWRPSHASATATARGSASRPS